MSKISRSPGRHSFQKEKYVDRQKEKNQPVSEDYLNLFDEIATSHLHKFDDPESHKNNLEYDLLTTDWILEKVRSRDDYAQHLYAAMCNTEFQKLDVMPILKEERWSCSWRYAGGIVADMREKGDYIDWYCSGIGGYDKNDPNKAGQYVGEGAVTDEIRADLKKLGWLVIDDDSDSI